MSEELRRKITPLAKGGNLEKLGLRSEGSAEKAKLLGDLEKTVAAIEYVLNNGTELKKELTEKDRGEFEALVIRVQDHERHVLDSDVTNEMRASVRTTASRVKLNLSAFVPKEKLEELFETTISDNLA